MVLAGRVVGYEINEHLHPGIMYTLHAVFKLLHTAFGVDGDSRVNIVIILNCIRRAGLPLDHIRIVGGYSPSGEIRFSGVFDDSSEPDTVDAHFLQRIQKGGRIVGKSARPIVVERAGKTIVGIGICKYAGESLVDYRTLLATANFNIFM